MSIKRTKQRTFGSDKEEEGQTPYFAKPVEPVIKWEDTADKPDDAFVPYSMTARFAKGALVLHSKFGRGIVTAVEQTSVVVLFQDGPKRLGHSAT